MQTDSCQCGQTLFFDNTQCVSCQSVVGWCDQCRRIAALLPMDEGRYRCHHADCQAELALCRNYPLANICNWTVPASAGSDDPGYCASCELTEIIPDLSLPEHRKRWYQLESAKRRLLYSLNLLGLPYRRSDPAADPPLRFRFLNQTRSGEPVATGHADGCITINLVETDEVEREKARVAFDEPQRTLIGHFRHEIGHYYWQVLVAGIDEPAFREVFGDERSPTYEEARNRYYQQGSPPDWKKAYISAYATMHPWEDFAETFAGYLDMISLLDTAKAHHLIDRSLSEFSEMIAVYQRWPIVLNEISRERGLLDLVPELLTPQVVDKLRYIRQLLPHSEPPAAA